MKYWLGRTDLDDTQLRQAIRTAGGFKGKSVTEPLLADQGFAKFMRGQQFNESQIQSSLQAAQEAAARRISGQAGVYDQQRTDARRGTNQGYESRGMFRSGGRLGALHRGQTSIDRNQTTFESGIGEAKAQMERDAAQKIAGGRRQRAEEELGARDRLTQASVVA
jgi:hypothetical protein